MVLCLYLSTCYLLSSLQGAFTEQHFDQDLSFHATEEDPVTKKVSYTYDYMLRSSAINVRMDGFF